MSKFEEFKKELAAVLEKYQAEISVYVDRDGDVEIEIGYMTKHGNDYMTFFSRYVDSIKIQQEIVEDLLNGN